MTRWTAVWVVLVALVATVAMACSSAYSRTAIGASREADRAYQECVDLNGEFACSREKEIAEQRRREMNERDLNRGKY